MCYIKAKDVLPIEVIEAIQQYIEGQYIYIPKKAGNRQQWGDKTRTRKELVRRDEQIYRDYRSGVHKSKLAEKYFLSRKSIDRIVAKEKNR